MKLQAYSPSPRQEGMALVIALVFLVLLTVIGIAALGSNILQQRMTFGSAERNAALQSADSALLAGENWISTQTAQPVGTCTSTSSTCTSPAIWARYGQATPPVGLTQLTTGSFWTGYGQSFGYTIPNAYLQPQYVIEDLGHDNSGSLAVGQSPPGYQTYYFQVTARGYGAQNTSSALVQSVYAKSY